jgi:hypothetical protein
LLPNFNIVVECELLIVVIQQLEDILSTVRRMCTLGLIYLVWRQMYVRNDVSRGITV